MCILQYIVYNQIIQNTKQILSQCLRIVSSLDCPFRSDIDLIDVIENRKRISGNHILTAVAKAGSSFMCPSSPVPFNSIALRLETSVKDGEKGKTRGPDPF